MTGRRFAQMVLGGYARDAATADEAPSVPRSSAVALSVEDAIRFLYAADATRWGPFMRLVLTVVRPDVSCSPCVELMSTRDASVTIRNALSQTRSGVSEKAPKVDRVRVVVVSPHGIDPSRYRRAVQAQDRPGSINCRNPSAILRRFNWMPTI